MVNILIVNIIFKLLKTYVMHINDTRHAAKLFTRSHITRWFSAIARQLNERPRKTLQFETPASKFN